MQSFPELGVLLLMASGLVVLDFCLRNKRYLGTKRRFVANLGVEKTLKPFNPSEHPWFDQSRFEAAGAALTAAGFTKLGGGELVGSVSDDPRNCFVIYVHIQKRCSGTFRQTFSQQKGASSITFSVVTKSIDGTVLVTRDHMTFSGLALTNELVESLPGETVSAVIQRHFERILYIPESSILPPPASLEDCVRLINERRTRQQAAMQKRNVLGIAFSFARWRRDRLGPTA